MYTIQCLQHSTIIQNYVEDIIGGHLFLIAHKENFDNLVPGETKGF